MDTETQYTMRHTLFQRRAVATFKSEDLEVSQNGATAITYPYVFTPDCNTGVSLSASDRFIVLGDQNASSVEGDAFTDEANVTAIDQLLASALVNPSLRGDSIPSFVPESLAGAENTPSSSYGATHTVSWSMRADYVLPSQFGFVIQASGVFWPAHFDDLSYLVEATSGLDFTSSDHRLVWTDVELSD